MSVSVRVDLRVPPALRERLKAYGRDQRMGFSTACRLAMQRGLAAMEGEAARRSAQQGDGNGQRRRTADVSDNSE